MQSRTWAKPCLEPNCLLACVLHKGHTLHLAVGHPVFNADRSVLLLCQVSDESTLCTNKPLRTSPSSDRHLAGVCDIADPGVGAYRPGQYPASLSVPPQWRSQTALLNVFGVGAIIFWDAGAIRFGLRDVRTVADQTVLLAALPSEDAPKQGLSKSRT
ncbi:hypothetical protein LX36DRAFT_668142 [Colletotrichum falcatum]|nr:hypothetical protein LX36DRAFT_668142 [Colletotrichum falcatum]